MHRAAVVVLLFAAPLLQGCIGFGADEGADDETLTKARAQVTDQTGGIEGIVTDSAVQPVPDATVLLRELGQSTTTHEDGSFALSEVPPGTYTILVNKTRFVPASDEVPVVAGSVATVDFVVTHLASDDPYTTAIELAGFIECGFATGYNTSATPVVGPMLPDQARRGLVLGWGFCSEPNEVVFENTTNDRFSHDLELDPAIHDLVWESQWRTGGNPLEGRMWLRVELMPFGASAFPGNYTFIDATGIEPPFRSVVYRAEFESTAEWLRQECEDGNDEACFSPFDEGWDIRSVFLAWYDCVHHAASTCAVAQLEFTHVVSGFYNGPAPEGYATGGPYT